MDDHNSYSGQDRGSAEAYASYYAGMDRSMRQKVALITSFFPTEGTIADMGSGSGKGSADLAALYPRLKVIGIDINPRAVERAKSEFHLPNLDFKQGDIADCVYPKNTFDGILNSSVLHHVTSFNGFSLQKLETLLDNQCEQLKDRGIIAIRDFVVPDGPEEVLLELPINDGLSAGACSDLSSSALFEKFLGQFCCNRYPQGGIPLELAEGGPLGWQRYKTSLRLATEFVLRKDYRSDWDTEIQEEYTYYSKKDFEKALRSRGLRLIVSRNLYNPWIVENRFQGKFRILDLNQNDWGFPPTNYLIVAEKTARGVVLQESSRVAKERPTYLELDFYEGKDGKVRELVTRPYPVFDVVPWFKKDGQINVLFRQGYPRPIVNAQTGQRLPDDCTASGFLNEPLAAVIKPSMSQELTSQAILKERAGISASAIREVTPARTILPSPGGTNEIVHSVLVELAEPPERELHSTYPTGFISEEKIRSTEAQQLLRSYQVGGMFDARLELSVYELLTKINVSWGPWIGADLPDARAISNATITAPEDHFKIPVEPNYFKKVPHTKSKFLQIWDGLFEERNDLNGIKSSRSFEYVTPRNFSCLSVVLVPYCTINNELCVGLEQRHLPAAQERLGDSRLLTFPAWRIPKGIVAQQAIDAFIESSSQKEFGVKIWNQHALGGSYFSSIGLSPEVVIVEAAPVDAVSRAALAWVSANELFKQREKIFDGHTAIALMRFIHAMGQSK